MEKTLTERAYKVGDDVKALEIMPNRFKSSSGLSDDELARAAFADLDPEFAGKANKGEYGIVVAGENFGGGGKTVEGPIFALRGAGIKLVIADSFARYFLRNAINNGFPILVCKGISAEVSSNDRLCADLDTGLIQNLTTGGQMQAQPLSRIALDILSAGGLVDYARQKLARSASGPD